MKLGFEGFQEYILKIELGQKNYKCYNIMNQKSNKKFNESSNFLYKKLNHSLSLQKRGRKLLLKQQTKLKVKNIRKTKQQHPLSHSLNLNDCIIQSQQKGLNSDVFFQLNKRDIVLSRKNLTPYQKIKQKFKITHSVISPKILPKKLSNQSQKEKQKNRTLIKSIQEQRKNKFFDNQMDKKRQFTNHQQSLTYSLILKNIQESATQDVMNQPLDQLNRVKYQNYEVNKCETCKIANDKQPPYFFRNQEIKKNIDQALKQISSEKQQKANYHHFPEVEVLNHKYFSQHQNKIIRNINQKSLIGHFNKMHLFLSKRKLLDCGKCKTCDKSKQKQNKSRLIRPSSFQYFVYEYKTSGTVGQSIQRKSMKSISHSKFYMKKNKLKLENKNINEKFNLVEKNQSKNLKYTFDELIKHSKIEIPKRPWTAQLKSGDQALRHLPRNNKSMTYKKIPGEQNFVKPWQHQNDADNFF